LLRQFLGVGLGEHLHVEHKPCEFAERWILASIGFRGRRRAGDFVSRHHNRFDANGAGLRIAIDLTRQSVSSHSPPVTQRGMNANAMPAANST
jgi:hypothetical protein